ncbi:ER membrane protein complex subunit 10 [Macadamia integrifolia]|uniref:ER membrane protein complex subunit 10 n=1 Tax=Macadamia integrifolia TaxID=60698 RepID=UPI001C4FC676|nr:ER membrane protein complex subunit 10 [Macadamia integrifolia]
MGRNREISLFSFCFVLCFSLLLFSSGFQSDELQDDEEFGLEGGRKPDLDYVNPKKSPSIRKRSSFDQDSDSKVHFLLEHAFSDSDFSPAGTFTARLKTWSHGGQTLTKLRFSRNGFNETENEEFKKLLKNDDFYRIRVPSNVLSPPGRDNIISSVKARCLLRETLDEHFVIHMEGVNILAVNYGSPGACQYPRPLKLPAKWSFNSHTVLKNSEQAPRAPAFVEETLVGENGEGEGIKPPEKSFWAKYWMYLIPLGLIVMNTITQAMNMPEEQASGQASSQTQTVQQRPPGSAVRRR